MNEQKNNRPFNELPPAGCLPDITVEQGREWCGRTSRFHFFRAVLSNLSSEVFCAYSHS